MKELQDVLVMLGLNVKLCSKLSSAKVGTGGDVIKEELECITYGCGECVSSVHTKNSI